MKGWLRLWAVLGLLVAMLPLGGAGAAGATMNATAIYQRWVDAINRGDIAAAMDFFTDDAIYDHGLTCESAGCHGKAEIQDEIEAMVSRHTQFTRTRVEIATYIMGEWKQTAVSGWSETRSDAYQDAGLDRFISVTTLGLREDKISSVTYLGDRTDTATKQYLDTHTATRTSLLPPTTTEYGRFIDVNGHAMYLECLGIGSPTVVLEAGAGYGGASQKLWNRFNLPTGADTIQPDIAKTTRVCAYDRAGYGLSEQGPVVPHTLQSSTDELHTLLHNAGIAGPHVLAGISLGGPIVRYFASQHPDEVAGLVLLDDNLEEFGDRYDALMQETMPPDFVQQRQDAIRKGRASEAGPDGFGGGLDYDAFDAQLRAMGAPPFVPIAVLVAAIPPNPADYAPGFPYVRRQQLTLDLQSELAHRFPGSTLAIADNSRHGMNFDTPQLIVRSVLDVVTAAQQRAAA